MWCRWVWFDRYNLKFTSFTEHGSNCRIQKHCIGTGRPAPHTGAQSALPCSFARRLVTQYRSTVQLTLQTDSAINIKIYLPKLYGNVFDDDHIEEINTERKKLYVNI